MLHLEKKKKGRLEMQFGNQNVLQLIENVIIFRDTCYLADKNWYLNTKKETQRMFLHLTKLSTFLCYL